jgi:hypothetical protein
LCWVFSRTMCLGWPRTWILLISASRVAKITHEGCLGWVGCWGRISLLIVDIIKTPVRQSLLSLLHEMNQIISLTFNCIKKGKQRKEIAGCTPLSWFSDLIAGRNLLGKPPP